MWKERKESRGAGSWALGGNRLWAGLRLGLACTGAKGRNAKFRLHKQDPHRQTLIHS